MLKIWKLLEKYEENMKKKRIAHKKDLFGISFESRTHYF